MPRNSPFLSSKFKKRKQRDFAERVVFDYLIQNEVAYETNMGQNFIVYGGIVLHCKTPKFGGNFTRMTRR
ncbi:MAG: hypothetical protein ABF238_00085 [Flavobacteriales bacterium]